MRSGLKPLAWITGVLAVPLVPLLVLGLSFESQVEDRLRIEMTAAARSALIAGLLAVDLFLPVPSSAVSTYGGGMLGMWPATAASFVGMTAGAMLGFALARWLGRRFALRGSTDQDLRQMEKVIQLFGPLALLVTRALPILAEACVVFAGSAGLSWKRFLPPVLVGNLLVSLCYAAVGAYFKDHDALPAAVVASGVVPLGIALVARSLLPGRDRPGKSE